jgi:hypothetical protein
MLITAETHTGAAGLEAQAASIFFICTTQFEFMVE